MKHKPLFAEGLARLHKIRVREFSQGQENIPNEVASVINYYDDGPIIWVRKDLDAQDRDFHILHNMGHVYTDDFKYRQHHPLGNCSKCTDAEKWAAKAQIPNSYIETLAGRPVTPEGIQEETGSNWFRVQLRLKEIARKSSSSYVRRFWRAIT